MPCLYVYDTARLSRWYLDTVDREGRRVPDLQLLLLGLRRDSGELDPAETEKWYSSARVARRTLIIRSSITGVGISGGEIVLRDLHVVSLSAKVRSSAHSLCRIV
eukprot:Polyplicarium_translucidae@DN2718_c0_g1_i5.p1